MRKSNRDDLVFVLPDHAFHVDRDASEAGIAAALLGAGSKYGLDFIDRHSIFDFGVVIFGDCTAATANDEEKQSRAQKVFK